MFFNQYIKQEITEDKFIEELKVLTTKIQTKNTLTEEQIEIINQSVDQINDECYNQHLELFVKFALYLTNRGVYQLLFETGWDKIKLDKENINVNILGLYIIKRVYNSENHKVLIIFLNDILRQQKTVEKKFVLLEVFVQIIPKIEKRELHLNTIFPIILIVINQGLQKYNKYKQQQLSNDLNENNQFTKLYLNQFQNWTVQFFKRIFDSIKKFPELKNQQVAIKELYGIDTQYDFVDNQLFRKPEDNKLLVKHTVLLFLSDLVQGILEVEQSMKDSQIDPDVISQLLTQVNAMINEIHDNKLEIIENYLIWLRFSIQFDQTLPEHYEYYQMNQTYNPNFICYLVREILKSNLEKILSVDYKLKILIGALYEQKKLNQTKCNIQQQLIDLIVQYLNQRDCTQKLKSACNFLTPFDAILLLIMERAGSGLEDEKPYLKAWKMAQDSFLPEVWTRILEQCINKSQNYHLLSHLVNHFRTTCLQLDPQLQIKYFDILIQAIFKKETGNVDQKVLLFDSVSLMIQLLILKKVNIKEIFDTKWKIHLKKFEKDIQQSIDYIEQRRKDDDENKLKEDKVYQAIIGQEQNIRIAYYNLQKVLNS